MRQPEISLGLGLATATVAYAIYQKGTPTHADIRVGKQGDDALETARKQSAWLAAGTVAGISLLAKDATIFIIGGLSVVALDWLTRSNNWTNPLSGRVDLNPFTTEVAERGEAPDAAIAYGNDYLQAVN